MSMIGKTLGNFEITSQIGKGGMGEVYRAKDRKLGRDVAIKVLPEEFARDTDRVARFQREAKLLASLNHPNIASIYGLEEADGTNFLVLELIEGETLAERLKHGPIPVEESLKLALQIAEALEAAHERAVIHRDLKPANIKVTPDGKVKVLDFGLAKAYAGGPSDVTLSCSPTLSDAATQQGVILGTAAYMPPEQAKGKTVDNRADIWAFGVVLFEMLTGRQLFTGETVSETLASVLKSEPEWKRLTPNLHPRIRFLLERCLEKEPGNRYGSIHDARVEIQKVLADPGGMLIQPVTTMEPRKKLRVGLSWVAGALVLGLIIAGVAVWKLKPSEPRQVMRFDYELPEGQQFQGLGISALDVSPDGKQFVYSTPKGLYLRSVNELNAKLIAGTEGIVAQPFFSPDGKSIGYFSVTDRQLKKISTSGGAPVTLCAVNQLVGAWWGADNNIVYGQLPGDMMKVSANGGTPQSLVKMKSEVPIFPQILPDGKSVLYTAAASTNQFRTMVQSPKLAEPKELFAGGAARYLPTGHIVYMLPTNNNLFAVAFDADKLEVKGGPVPIVEGVIQASVSDAGTLVYIPGGTTSGATQSGRTLVWVNREGKEEPLGTPPNNYMYPKISPNGREIALSVAEESSGSVDIWIWDIVRKNLTKLTFDKKLALPPIWTLDGKRIVYWSDHEVPDTGAMYWKPADGTGQAEKLGSAPDRRLLPYAWSSDGKTLVLNEVIKQTTVDLGIFAMEGTRTRKPLLATEYVESQPEISSDGRWIAYASDESGRIEIYVRPFPEVNKGKWQASTSGGNSPLWSPDGRELFYLSEDNSVMSIAVETKPTLSLGTPRVLFRSTNVGFSITGGTPWDISPDGKRFLMMKPPASTGGQSAEQPGKINIVLNWLEELKQRVPVR
jgi:serine/threonine protein kinase/Tol biopolymer transport system component